MTIEFAHKPQEKQEERELEKRAPHSGQCAAQRMSAIKTHRRAGKEKNRAQSTEERTDDEEEQRRSTGEMEGKSAQSRPMRSANAGEKESERETEYTCQRG